MTWGVGRCDKVIPVLQMIGSTREPDTGAGADPDNTGYARLILSPGVEANIGRVVVYADAEFPVVQYVKGNQLTAPVLVKAVIAYTF